MDRPARVALRYLGEHPLFEGLAAARRGWESEPCWAWTTFARADGRAYRALAAWLPVGDGPPLFQICPVEEFPGSCSAGLWVWSWDGDLERPTLKESIQSTVRPPAPYWHGHIVEGCWEPCDDTPEPPSPSPSPVLE